MSRQLSGAQPLIQRMENHHMYLLDQRPDPSGAGIFLFMGKGP